MFDLAGAGWLGWFWCCFVFGFFFNDSLQLLAILELSSLKTKFTIIHCSLVAA